MGSTRHGGRWAGGLLVLMSACATGASVAWASPPPVDEVLVERRVPEAMAEADGKGKLLVVEIAGNTDRERQAKARWASPVVRSWMVRNAIGVLLTDTTTIRQFTENDLNPGPDADPLVFKSGKQVRVFGSGLPQKKSRLHGPGRPGESYVGLALKLDWTLRGKDETQPAEFDPASAGRVRDRKIYLKESEEAKAAPDLSAHGPAGVLARVQRARTLAQSKDSESLREATGLYTWLWEQGVAAEPRMRSARWLIIAPAMETLTGAHSAARGRWMELRRAMLDELDVRDHAAMFDLFILSRVIGDHEDNLAFIDSALNDPDAAMIMPAGERVAWEMILPACHWLPAGASDPIGRMAQLDQRAARMLKPLTGGSKAAAEATWARLRVMELARTYVTALARGQDEQAAKVVELAPASARGELVFAALCAGEAREAQKALCADDAALLEAVALGLKGVK